MNQKLIHASRILREDIFSLRGPEHCGSFLKLLVRVNSMSARNAVLLYFQKPDTVMAAGYYVWKERYGRCVKKGEKALTILSKRGNMDDPSSLRTISVFDVSQTAGNPLPPGVLPGNSHDPQEYSLLLEAAVLASPLSVHFEEIPDGSSGYFRPIDRDIIIRSGMSLSETFHTVMREAARALLYERNPLQSEECRRRRAFEAECSAFALCSFFGFSSKEPAGCFDDLNTTEELLASFERIRSVCSRQINEVRRIRCPDIRN